MRPDLVPVCGDRGASRNSGSELEGTRGAIVIASDLRVGRVRDRVAKEVKGVTLGRRQLSTKSHVLGRPGTLDGGLTVGRVVRSPGVRVSEKDRGKEHNGAYHP